MKPNCLKLTTENKVIAHLTRASLFIHRYKFSHSKLRHILSNLRPYLNNVETFKEGWRIPKQIVKKG